MGILRTFVRFVVAGAATGLLLAAAAPAQAAPPGEICGYRAYDPARDGLDLPRFLEDGQGRVNDGARKLAGFGPWACAPLRYAVELGASQVSEPGGLVLRTFRIRLPDAVEFVLFVRDAIEALPPSLPAVGPDDSVTGTVSWTGPAGLWLNSGPGTGDQLTVLADGTRLTLLCQIDAVAVTGPYGRTTLWDLVALQDGRTGFVTDAYIFTGSDGVVAPPC